MSESPQALYKKILEISKEATVLASISGILEWDQETYMPPAAIGLRSQQIEMMAHLVHKHRISPRFKGALAKLIDLQTGTIAYDTLSQEQMAALREWRRDYLKTACLPAAFVKKLASTTSQALHAWADAKQHNRFRNFQPHLEKILTLLRKKADLLGFQEHPYDALLDLYEPEMTVGQLVPLFGRLKIALMTLLKNTQAKPRAHDQFLHQHYPPAAQMRFGQLLLKAMGFEAENSRLDQSMHPFCSGLAPSDTRMTTHIHEEIPMANFFAVLHEGGHGLYHQGLPEEHFGSPLGESVSLGIDESQSRWWETLIGHSYPFWQHFFPLLQEEFSEQLGGINLDTFYQAINIVRPSLIRIHADEVTYNLHIIIRFEIEKALIEGTLKTKEIPEVWNEKMREYLGVEPQSDSEGCLQDIHWAMGGIGYFPTYTLGNLYAAQLFETFCAQHPNWESRLHHGDLAFIRTWLEEKIYRFGRQYPPTELIQRATGHPLSEQPYIAYLTKKFNGI